MHDTVAALIGRAKGDPELAQRIRPADSIVDDLGLDSLQLVNLILLVEAEFDIEVDFESFEREHLSSVAKFCEFIERQRTPA